MSTEIWLAAGGDFIQTANGDLLLAQDTAYTTDATSQRIQRLLTTNARLTASNGAPISTPGDLFNPNYGASLPALVDQPVNAAFLSSIQARIQSALASDPTIAPSPAPVVTVTQNGNGNGVLVSITATTVNGQAVVIPSLPLPLGGT